MNPETDFFGCPFCGANPQVTKHHKYDLWSLVHRCTVFGSLFIDWTSYESLKARWNTRREPSVRLEDVVSISMDDIKVGMSVALPGAWGKINSGIVVKVQPDGGVQVKFEEPVSLWAHQLIRSVEEENPVVEYKANPRPPRGQRRKKS